MRQFYLIIAFNLLCIPFFAQKMCERSEVYFERGKWELTPEAIGILNENLAKMQGGYLIELAGHTDSTSSQAYNLKLSSQRVEAVAQFFNDHYANGKLKFHKLGLGEIAPKFPNTDAQSMRQNRRVEIGMIPMQGAEIIISGENGTQVMINPDYFSQCPVCETNPSVRFFSSNDESEKSGIDFPEMDNDASVFKGYFSLNNQCLPFRPIDTCIPLKLIIPAKDYVPGTYFMTSCVDGGWREEHSQVTYDSLTNSYCIAISCFRSKCPFYCGWKPGCITEIATYEYFKWHQTTVEIGNEKITFSNPILSLERPIDYNQQGGNSALKMACDTLGKIYSFALLKDRFYVLDARAQLFELDFHVNKTFRNYKIPFEAYTEIPRSDTTLQLRFHRKLRGKYRPQLNLIGVECRIDFKRGRKGTFSVQPIQFPHLAQLGYGKKKLLTLDLANCKSKFYRKTKTLQIKITPKMVALMKE